MAPEVLKNKKSYSPYFGQQVDIFSLGAMLFMMVSGNIPFEEAS